MNKTRVYKCDWCKQPFTPDLRYRVDLFTQFKVPFHFDFCTEAHRHLWIEANPKAMGLPGPKPWWRRAWAAFNRPLPSWRVVFALWGVSLAVLYGVAVLFR